jgi:hypothetical protein
VRRVDQPNAALVEAAGGADVVLDLTDWTRTLPQFLH